MVHTQTNMSNSWDIFITCD